MHRNEFQVGDEIEVIDQRYTPGPMRGTILELDLSFLGGNYAKVRLLSASLPVPEIWVNLRLAKKCS